MSDIRISLNRRRVLYENLSLLTASYSQGRLIVEGVLYKNINEGKDIIIK